ncbi:MAG: glycosyltransferase [Pseudomonadota bacterium]
MINKVVFFLPHLAAGGSEIVVLRLLQCMDRTRFAPELILQRQRGELLPSVPADVPVHILRRARPPGCIVALSRTCRLLGADLVVTVTNAASLYALAANRLSSGRFATMVTEHTPPLAYLSEAKFAGPRRYAMTALFPNADLTAGPLDEIGQDLKHILGRRAPPFVALPNPVVDRVRVLRPVSDCATNVVSVGRLSPEKRFSVLIAAFAQVHARRPDARLTIYGEGSQRAELEAQIASLGLSGSVSLPGFEPDMDVAHAQSDLFVCTSSREGLGNAIIEAMARGVPVLSVDCPFGPRHLLQNGKAGELLERNDPASVARAVTRLLDDAERRACYASAGLDAVAQYDVARAVSRYEHAFDTAVSAWRENTR